MKVISRIRIRINVMRTRNSRLHSIFRNQVCSTFERKTKKIRDTGITRYPSNPSHGVKKLGTVLEQSIHPLPDVTLKVVPAQAELLGGHAAPALLLLLHGCCCCTAVAAALLLLLLLLLQSY
jgi:hypothetical protein